MDAGHTRSSAAGEHLYAIECSSQNRRDGAKLERAGHILEKAVVLIEGLPINRAVAHDWEQKGVFKKGTVEAAPLVVGWSKEHGVVTSRARPTKETSAALVRAQKLKEAFDKVAAPQKGLARAKS